MQHYYRLPLAFGKLTRREKHPRCPLEASVKQNIHLILLSRFGEYPYDASYGCTVWDQDFALTANTVAWKEKIRKSIIATVQAHEKRIAGLAVQVEIAEDEFQYVRDESVRKVKRRISVEINGVLRDTNETFDFKEDIFISPVSLD